MKQIDSLETVEMEQTVYVDYRELYRGWLVAGLLLLLSAVFLEHTVLLRVP